MKPTIGRIVHVNLPPDTRTNSQEVCAAIVTNVFPAANGEQSRINVTCMRDLAFTNRCFANVPHVDDVSPHPDLPTWFWPPRE